MEYGLYSSFALVERARKGDERAVSRPAPGWGNEMSYRFVTFLLILIGAARVAGAGQTGAADRSSDEQAIKAVIAATTEAFSRHDAKAWVRFCTPDAQLVTVRGESMKGIAAIEKGLTAVFQTRARNATLEALDVTVRFVRPDVALAHVMNQMVGLLSPEGQTMPPHTELSIRVLVKDNGSWRITAFHNTIVQH